jgi:hypothetical protein
MAQAVSRRPPTAAARLRSRVNPRGICGGQSGTGTDFSPSSLVFPCQFYSTGAPLLGKRQKIIIIFIVITVLHNKPQGCSASVAPAAGPFTTKEKVSCSQESHVLRLITGIWQLLAGAHPEFFLEGGLSLYIIYVWFYNFFIKIML